MLKIEEEEEKKNNNKGMKNEYRIIKRNRLIDKKTERERVNFKRKIKKI